MAFLLRKAIADFGFTVKLADFGVSGQLSATMTKKVCQREREKVALRWCSSNLIRRTHSLERRIGWYAYTESLIFLDPSDP